MINTTFEQRVAISPAWVTPMASEEIAGAAAYRNAAPVGVQRQGSTVPSGVTAPLGTGVPGAGGPGCGAVPMKANRIALAMRDRFAGVPGIQPRGRPV
jgi:hypothetical protein